MDLQYKTLYVVYMSEQLNKSSIFQNCYIIRMCWYIIFFEYHTIMIIKNFNTFQYHLLRTSLKYFLTSGWFLTIRSKIVPATTLVLYSKLLIRFGPSSAGIFIRT